MRVRGAQCARTGLQKVSSKKCFFAAGAAQGLAADAQGLAGAAQGLAGSAQVLARGAQGLGGLYTNGRRPYGPCSAQGCTGTDNINSGSPCAPAVQGCTGPYPEGGGPGASRESRSAKSEQQKVFFRGRGRPKAPWPGARGFSREPVSKK